MSVSTKQLWEQMRREKAEGPQHAQEDTAQQAEAWLVKFNRESNEALAKRAAEKQTTPAPNERALVEALARKDFTEYDRLRVPVAETLGIRVGTLDDKPWSYVPPEGSKALQMKQYLRVEGMIDHPREAVVKTVQVRVYDASGGVKATQVAKV